jgi:hypothetical protein
MSGGEGNDEPETSQTEEESAAQKKRRAPDESPEDIEEVINKRTRRHSTSSQATSILSSGSGVRNLIEASFSSSRRWLQKQVSTFCLLKYSPMFCLLHLAKCHQS